MPWERTNTGSDSPMIISLLFKNMVQSNNVENFKKILIVFGPKHPNSPKRSSYWLK